MRQLTILIGRATGFVGSQLVAHLSAHHPHVQVRALTRTPESDTARHFAALPGVTVVRGNYGDVQSLEVAAEGADRAYVACNNVAEQHRFECNLIDACKGKGVVVSPRSRRSDIFVEQMGRVTGQRIITLSSTCTTVAYPM